MSSNKSLAEYQQYVEKVVRERGFADETVSEVFLLLIEEIGELGKAIRKSSGMKSGKHSKEHSIEEESADVFFLLVDLCNRLGIDLADSFEQKEVRNRKRTWS